MLFLLDRCRRRPTTPGFADAGEAAQPLPSLISLAKRLGACGRFDCCATCLFNFHLDRSQIGLQRIDPIPQAIGPLPLGVS